MLVSELKAELQARGLSTTGRKADLQRRLDDANSNRATSLEPATDVDFSKFTVAALKAHLRNANVPFSVKLKKAQLVRLAVSGQSPEADEPSRANEAPIEVAVKSLTCAELRTRLRQLGLGTVGKKADLVERLENAGGPASDSDSDSVSISLVEEAPTVDLTKLKVVELKKLLRSRNLPTDGRKSDLIARLVGPPPLAEASSSELSSSESEREEEEHPRVRRTPAGRSPKRRTPTVPVLASDDEEDDEDAFYTPGRRIRRGDASNSDDDAGEDSSEEEGFHTARGTAKKSKSRRVEVERTTSISNEELLALEREVVERVRREEAERIEARVRAEILEETLESSRKQQEAQAAVIQEQRSFIENATAQREDEERRAAQKREREEEASRRKRAKSTTTTSWSDAVGFVSRHDGASKTAAANAPVILGQNSPSVATLASALERVTEKGITVEEFHKYDSLLRSYVKGSGNDSTNMSHNLESSFLNASTNRFGHSAIGADGGRRSGAHDRSMNRSRVLGGGLPTPIRPRQHHQRNRLSQSFATQGRSFLRDAETPSRRVVRRGADRSTNNFSFTSHRSGHYDQGMNASTQDHRMSFNRSFHRQRTAASSASASRPRFRASLQPTNRFLATTTARTPGKDATDVAKDILSTLREDEQNSAERAEEPRAVGFHPDARSDEVQARGRSRYPKTPASFGTGSSRRDYVRDVRESSFVFSPPTSSRR